MIFNSLNLFIFIGVLNSVVCNKYSGNINEHAKRDFRMGKIQMLWEKAQKVLKGRDLDSLYADLIVQDKRERSLKKIKTENADPDGLKEAETRQHFVDIIVRYDLEKHYRDELKENKKKTGKPELKDDNLKKLWKNAALEGFSEDEMKKLREEFSHQQLKLDEYEALKVQYNDLQGQVDNSVEALDDQDELWKSLSLKKKHLKDKHVHLREQMAMLEKKSKGPGERQEREFKDSRVYHLWNLAQKSNMTDEELESLKKELTHFEHRIMKHDMLQNEVQRSASKLKDNEDHHHHEELVNKVDSYGRKVEKYHKELKRKINEALEHTEL